ncbi:retrovirus-related Pol polyprotein from transposon 297 [Trichonephila clavipes]|uniref:Retrovirus-related Pol polyprotein from transposon 297 n=1 Tax=Trichonephila clavipes TaxID=2585209 RepID=A0A8X6VQF4_TRICX|nr:retrovirus-related Pol polyprotein from transposon 297 [Trichonephila clavipes]
MPFGLCNAPATFERMMDNLLRHLKWTMCLCYLDDIIVFSDTFGDHLQRLRSVLKYIQDASLVLNPKKCMFGSRQIRILGHLVSEEGIMPDPGKVRAVQNFPVPKNMQLKDPSGRLARWALRLQEHELEIVYKSGKKHKDADSLSRNPVEDEVFPYEQKTTLESFSDIAEEQRKDPQLSKLIHTHEKAEPVTK